MVSAQFKELFLQALEHERGGVLVYRTALECAINDELRQEWEKYLSQTTRHVEVLTDVCKALGLDAREATPG
jgi:ferritin-like metal-binding protein YciE